MGLQSRFGVKSTALPCFLAGEGARGQGGVAVESFAFTFVIADAVCRSVSRLLDRPVVP